MISLPVCEKFQDGYIYPLKDTTQFDNDEDQGFDHVLVAAHGIEGCYIVDCWIVNKLGNQRHQGYSVSPIPVHSSDVDIENGTYMESVFNDPEPSIGWQP